MDCVSFETAALNRYVPFICKSDITKIKRDVNFWTEKYTKAELKYLLIRLEIEFLFYKNYVKNYLPSPLSLNNKEDIKK
jgi:hypothetical protein